MDTHRAAQLKKTAGLLTLGAAAVGAYTFIIRPRQNRWGATDEEWFMRLPGDEIVKQPNMNSTRAITIDADPDDIWPWIVQMGKGRGGLYSYDWLDIAFRMLDEPSSNRILSQFQALKAGDVIPIGRDDSVEDDFYVHNVEPPRSFVIGAYAKDYRDRVSWSINLIPKTASRTRLVMRVRGDIPMNVKGIATYAFLEPAAFVMVRKQMLNLKRLGERTHRLNGVRGRLNGSPSN